MGRSLLGLGLRDDIVESFGRSVSGAARDGVRRTIDRNTRGGRDARGRYRRRVASADVLFLLLGLGRGVFGFRRGRDVLLVVRHRGARRGLHRARARFERGSPSADAFRRRRREETTGTSASASRVPVPSRPAAVPPRRAMRDAREVRCPGDAADARARGCARRARGTSENHESLPGVLNGPLFEVGVSFFRGFWKSRATLGVYDPSHQKCHHRNERNARCPSTFHNILHTTRRSFVRLRRRRRAPRPLRAAAAHPPRPRRGALGEALRAVRARGPPHRPPRGVRPVPEHEPVPNLRAPGQRPPRHRHGVCQTPPAGGAERRPRRRRPTAVSFDRVRWMHRTRVSS